jgi:hypothetical protein
MRSERDQTETGKPLLIVIIVVGLMRVEDKDIITSVPT